LKEITFNTIDISNASGLTFRGLFGAHSLPCGSSKYDDEEKIEIYFSVDGAPEVLALCFRADLECNIPNDISNETFHHDPNCDGDGGEGTQLLPGLQEFMFTIPDGSTLDIRMEVLAESGDEEMAVDWFRVEAMTVTQSCTAEAGTLSGTTETICAGGTSTVSVSGNENSPQYTQVFLIVDAGLNVIDIQSNPMLTFSTPGTYTVYSYNYETAGTSPTNPATIGAIDCGSNCCDLEAGAFTITVLANVTGTFTAPADLCESDDVLTGQGGGLPIGGVYSGPGVTDDANGMTYSFDPAAAGAGNKTITYTPSGLV
jgi:hypothetical protein